MIRFWVSTLKAAFVGLLLVCLAQHAEAQTGFFTWTGAGGSTAWDNSNNWVDDQGIPGVPGPTDTAIFDDTALSFAVDVLAPTFVGDVEFSNNAIEYTINIFADGGGELAPFVAGNLSLVGAGLVTFESLSPGNSAAQFNNVDIFDGTLSTGMTGQILVPGGQLTVHDSPSPTPPTLLLQEGPTSVEANLFQINGLLRGNGTAIGAVVNNGAISPGLSPGLIQIDGDYTQTSNGTLQLEVDSSNAFDEMEVSGDANLAGTLEVLVPPGPQQPSTAVIDVDGSLTGVFESVDTIGDDEVFYAPEYSNLPTLNTVSLFLYLEGDMNIDGLRNALDVDAFVMALRNREEYFGNFFVDGDESGDIDNDNDLDFDDIDEFIALIPNTATSLVYKKLAGIPEPASGLLLFVLLAAGSLSRMR